MQKEFIFRVSLQNLNTLSKELGPLSMNRCIVKKTIFSRIFYHNGKTIEDPSEIANAFNEYFISIGPSLANTIDKNNNCRKYCEALLRVDYILNQ